MYTEQKSDLDPHLLRWAFLLFMKVTAGVGQWDRLHDRSSSGGGKSNQDCPENSAFVKFPWKQPFPAKVD